MTIGLLHPGDMGASIGAALAANGQSVLWASEDRSSETAARAALAELVDAGTVTSLVESADVILSICPPHAAVGVAASVADATASGKYAVYVDANAVAPATARHIARRIEQAGMQYVDGGIIGPPARSAGTTRLYLSGPGAVEVSNALASPLVEIHIVSDQVGDASALKLTYAAWTKGSGALLIATRAAAARAGVEDALLQEWKTSLPGTIERHDTSERAAADKGWRWVGEMEEIAAMFAELGLPDGFHLAAAEVFGHPPLRP